MGEKIDVEILMLGPQIDMYVEEVEQHFTTVHKLWKMENPSEFLQQHGHKFTALATSGGVGAKQDLIDALPNLKIIASSGVGYDSIAVDYAKSKNIIVTNTPDVLNDCVADTGMMLMYAVARQLIRADRFVRVGQWAKGAYPLTTSLGNKVCGILGMGNIGKEVAKRAEACGMQIIYHNRKPKTGSRYEYAASVEELAEKSDFLVLALPSTAATQRIITTDILQRLGKTGFLINIARGSVVDEDALIAALEQGVIAGAGLDVYAHEPCSESPLFALENVVLTPHYASGTRETRKAMGDLACANLVKYFTENQVITAV